MTDLTARQTQVLDFIRKHIADNGGAPTRAEIAAAFGLRSANSAEQYLRTLAEKGHLEVTGQARGIRLAAQHRERRVEMLKVPVVGRVAAGLPILAVENLDDHRDLAANLFEPAPDFLLRIKGHSMRDAGILDGDLVAADLDVALARGCGVNVERNAARASSGKPMRARLRGRADTGPGVAAASASPSLPSPARLAADQPPPPSCPIEMP